MSETFMHICVSALCIIIAVHLNKPLVTTIFKYSLFATAGAVIVVLIAPLILSIVLLIGGFILLLIPLCIVGALMCAAVLGMIACFD